MPVVTQPAVPKYHHNPDLLMSETYLITDAVGQGKAYIGRVFTYFPLKDALLYLCTEKNMGGWDKISVIDEYQLKFTVANLAIV